MLSPELTKLMQVLESDVDNITINPDALLKELHALYDVEECLQESLSLSGKVCPTCGRSLL